MPPSKRPRLPEHDNPSGPPLFRDTGLYKAPERARWTQFFKNPPYELTSVDTKFLEIARDAIARDYSTIETEAVTKAHFDLARIHLDVATAAELDDLETVFFDPLTDSFWVYPER